MNNQTKQITNIAMLCALAYSAVAIGRIPITLFLKYEPKDVIIIIGGLIWGPLTSFYVSVIVSFVEMFTISETGILGCMMNILSSCAFACPAAFIYKKKKTLAGIIVGLTVGYVSMVSVMLLWNYLITPIYMGYPREAVVKLLLPVFLPFNLLKGGLNTGFTFLLYKPVVTALRKTGYVSQLSEKRESHTNVGLVLFSIAIIATCILVILSMNGII